MKNLLVTIGSVLITVLAALAFSFSIDKFGLKTVLVVFECAIITLLALSGIWYHLPNTKVAKETPPKIRLFLARTCLCLFALGISIFYPEIAMVKSAIMRISFDYRIALYPILWYGGIIMFMMFFVSFLYTRRPSRKLDLFVSISGISVVVAWAHLPLIGTILSIDRPLIVSDIAGIMLVWFISAVAPLAIGYGIYTKSTFGIFVVSPNAHIV